MKTVAVNLGSVERIALGHGMCFIVEGEEIAVFRSRSGGLFSISNRCPHRQGPLSEGVIGEGKVICPLHGHKFDLTTGQGSEAQECVKTFKAWEENKNILIDMDKLDSRFRGNDEQL